MKKSVSIVGGFDESLKTHEDWDLWIRLSRSFEPHHIKKTTAKYIVRQGVSGQMTTDPSSNYNETRKMIYRKYADFVRYRPDTLRAQEAELFRNDPALARKGLLAQLHDFMAEVSRLIEKGDISGGIALFDMHRRKFPDTIAELSRIDLLMSKIRPQVGADRK